MILVLLSYTLGLFVGMLVMSALLKSRFLYHINIFDINKIFNRKK